MIHYVNLMMPDAPIFFTTKKANLFIMWHLHHFMIYILQKNCYSQVYECSPILLTCRFLDFCSFNSDLGGRVCL